MTSKKQNNPPMYLTGLFAYININKDFNDT